MIIHSVETHQWTLERSESTFAEKQSKTKPWSCRQSVTAMAI